MENENQSQQLDALAAALSKAQGAMENAKKDSLNPAFRSGESKGTKYADLASVWDACRGPLSANGLAVVQQVSNAQGGVVVTTMLLHSSGQWLKDRLLIPVAGNTAQALGSAVTYGRRYSLMAIVGIAPEDDDGNEATANAPKSQDNQDKGRKTTRPQASAKEAKEPTPPPSEPSGKATEEAALKARRSRIWLRAKELKATEGTFKTWASQVLGAAKPSQEITAEDCAKLEAELTANGFQVVPEPPVEPKPNPTEDGEITGDVMLSRIATEFGMTLADVLKRAQGVCNGKKSGYSLADAKAVRDSLGAIPKGAK